MKCFNGLVISILLLVFTLPCSAEDLADLFKKHGVKGTMIISSLKGDKVIWHNKKRASERFIPASTFKIPNTLIALETGALKDEHETLKWDGKKRWLEAWNRDHNLTTAFPASVVWFYQEIARRVGTAKYIEILKKLDYGNMNPGPELTSFWLIGDLRISAEEQIKFLKKLYHKKLPFKDRNFEILKKIMVVEKNSEYTLRAKTGSTGKFGWYVGYVVTKDNVWFFAMNLDYRKSSDGALRKTISMEALKLKGII